MKKTDINVILALSFLVGMLYGALKVGADLWLGWVSIPTLPAWAFFTLWLLYSVLAGFSVLSAHLRGKEPHATPNAAFKEEFASAGLGVLSGLFLCAALFLGKPDWFNHTINFWIFVAAVFVPAILTFFLGRRFKWVPRINA